MVAVPILYFNKYIKMKAIEIMPVGDVPDH